MQTRPLRSTELTALAAETKIRGPMFTALLIGLAAALAVGAGLVIRTRRELGAGPEPKLLAAVNERTISELRRGDVVQYIGRDFLVDGVVRYDEDGHRWLAARIVDGADERWLLVGIERAGSRGARLLALTRDIEVGSHPPEVLVEGDERYRLEKRGVATASLDGDVGDLAASRETAVRGTVARCRWWLYEAVDGDTIFVERWGDDFRVLTGKSIQPGALDFLPGS